MGFLASSHSSSRPRFELEELESRVLLTTIGGPFGGTFEFQDVRDNIIRITVGPGTVAEFIGVQIDDSNTPIVTDLAPPTLGAGGAVVTGQNLGTDLFHIYVAESNPDSWISIARVDHAASGRPIVPYEGNLTFRIFPNRPVAGPLPTVDIGPGQALIGALSRQLEGQENLNNIPFSSTLIPPGPWGVRPDPAVLGDPPFGPNFTLFPGIYVADGVDIGRIVVGGAVTGRVHIPQSIELFYAGALLTGQPAGQGQGAPTVPNNFRVGGDIRNLMVAGPFGSDEVAEFQPDTGDNRALYVTGFDMFVGGRVGQIWGQESLMGNIRVEASQFAPTFPRPIREAEGAGPGRNFANGFPDNEVWDNGSFDTPQYVNSLSGGLEIELVHIQGSLATPGSPGSRNDPVDYFAVPLLAGQQVTVQLFSGQPVQVGVFDPDGRQVASDYSRMDPGATAGQAFSFVPDRPGAYRFAVSAFGDFDFLASPSPFSAEYDLMITGTGGIAVGGIVVGEQYYTPTAQGIYVHAGDFGGLFAGGNVHGTLAFGPGTETIIVNQGNLRALVADNIGPNIFTGVHLAVHNGHVGLLRSTTGSININPLHAQFESREMAILGDYQLVDTAGNLSGGLIANGNIGVIRAASVTTGMFIVNANHIGRDGTIDLIDVAGNLGTLNTGGPAIMTGPGGNVRYMRVGGAVFNDLFFGGGGGQQTIHSPGETVRFRDDSGSIIHLRALGPVTENPAWDPLDPNSPQFFGPQLTTVTYGIRDSGGVVVVRVDSTGGLQINTSGRTAEIGHININVSGPDVVVGTVPPLGTTRRFNPMQFDIDAEAPVAAVDLRVNGRARTDIFSIAGANISNIENRTGGEIVNVIADSIGNINSRGTVGVARTTTHAALNGVMILADGYPYNQQRMGIVSGNVISVNATGGVGNLIVAGSVGEVNVRQARHLQGVFQGVRAPIFATEALFNVRIGQGVAPSGAGDFAHSGIFAGGVIWVVEGRGGNIWGTVASQERVREISLRDGAIIGSNIMVVTDLEMSRDIPAGVVLPSFPLPVDQPDFRIGQVNLRGRNSGVIGSGFLAAGIGLVTVRGGFGVLNTVFGTEGTGVIAGVRTDGYGVRDVFFGGGQVTQLISATGRGQNLSTQQFNPAVRRSEGATNIDPLFGFAVTRRNDLHAFLGTSEAAPAIEGITNAGVIENVFGQGLLQLGRLFAHQVRGVTLNYANNIDVIDVRDTAIDLFVTTGRIGEFRIGREALALDIRVAGLIRTLDIGGNLGTDSFIEAFGPDGEFGAIRIAQNHDGEIYAANRIGSLVIGGNHSGTTEIDGLQGGVILNSARIAGDLWAPGFLVRGSVGRLDVRSVVETGDTLFINGLIDDLNIRGDLRSNLRVLGTANRITVGGSIREGSEIQVDDVIGSLVVNGDIEPNVLVQAWQLNRLQVRGANNGTFVILG